MGTIGLIAWLVAPAVFVLIVAIVAIGLYVRSITLGVSWRSASCADRRSSSAFWAVVAVVDAYWIFVLGQQPSDRLTASGASATLRQPRRVCRRGASGPAGREPARATETPGLGR